MRIGIEVGGTFTDLIGIDSDGTVRIAKVPSVPHSPDEGAFAALAAAAISLADARELVHGSTLATNAVLQRSGGRVAFVTTRGFRDLLLLQRQNRSRIYDLRYQKPTPIVARTDCHEAVERMLADGSVELPLDVAQVEQELLPRLAAQPYDAVAVCLLNACANPAHERALAEILAAHLPNLPVVCSSEIAPVVREYERACTTALAAHVQPVIASYLERFEQRLRGAGFKGELSLMQSNGGRTTAREMARNPVTALFSGPAAGAIGAVRQAGRSGYGNLITFDMGGTSTDVSLVEQGRLEITGQTEMDGLPVVVPLVDIVSIGAGCGSIVWRDAGGMLRVGPASAGGDPGPACYGKGGAAPTLTDSHVVRGTIRPEAFLGGAVRIDPAAAEQALLTLAESSGDSAVALADAAIRVADDAVVRAIQRITTERGRDPREFVLVAYGGAGALHAAAVAAELEIGTVLVPPYAGVLSAYGLLAADYQHFHSETHRMPLDGCTLAEVRRIFGAMRKRALQRFREAGIASDDLNTVFTLEMRFVGQAFEIPVHFSEAELATLDEPELREAFTTAYRRDFAHVSTAQREIELLTFRLGLIAPTPTQTLQAAPLAQSAPAAGPHHLRLGAAGLPCAVQSRQSLTGTAGCVGPTVLEDVTSTVFVPPGWRAHADAAHNLILNQTD